MSVSASRTAARASGDSMRVSDQTAFRRAADRGPARDHAGQRVHAISAAFGKLSDRAVPHLRARVVQQFRQFDGRRIRPVDLRPSRVLGLRHVPPTDPVNAPLDVRLGDLRGRAADAEPAAGVDDQQAAVGVLQDVGRVEIGVAAGEEVLVARAEGRAVAREDVAHHLMGVEVAAEEVVAVFGAEPVAAVAHDARRGGRDHVVQRRQQVAGRFHLVGGDRVAEDGVIAPFDRVDEGIPHAGHRRRRSRRRPRLPPRSTRPRPGCPACRRPLRLQCRPACTGPATAAARRARSACR